MALRRQAKTLTKSNVMRALTHVRLGRNGLRNEVILLLSVKAGLRAKEIASLTWRMVLDADGVVGNHILLSDEASKGKSGRSIPLNRDLREALTSLHRIALKHGADTLGSQNIITTERQARTTPQVIVNMFHRWYAEIGLQGCSSHSGRRTFITNAARKKQLRKKELGTDPPNYGLVVCHRDGDKILSFKKAFRNLLEYAGIPEGRDGMSRTIYSLRHFYATQRLTNETNPFLLARQMGTSVEMLEKFYGQTVTSDVAVQLTKGGLGIR